MYFDLCSVYVTIKPGEAPIVQIVSAFINGEISQEKLYTLGGNFFLAYHQSEEPQITVRLSCLWLDERDPHEVAQVDILGSAEANLLTELVSSSSERLKKLCWHINGVRQSQ